MSNQMHQPTLQKPDLMAERPGVGALASQPMNTRQSRVTSATPFQSKYWATQLALRSAGGSINQLSGAISNARVDLNPHQVDAALFAVRSPFSKGVILADEVGLAFARTDVVNADPAVMATLADKVRELAGP